MSKKGADAGLNLLFVNTGESQKYRAQNTN